MRRTTRRARIGLVIAALAALLIGLNTDLNSPPRYDGAGYSLLGRALQTGQGYRDIDLTDSPPHAHFPPGYPLVLAGLWTLTGRSVVAAHLFSIGCTVAAVGLAWIWLRRIERRRVADLLALAIAVNWMWSANGGSIQSEPLYLMLSILTILLARRSGSIALGMLLGACILTRHVGICLLVAIVLDRLIDRRWRDAARIVVIAAIVVSPWIFWLVTVKRTTQAGLLQREGLASLIGGQTLFYARRLPDMMTGPFVEVATVFGRSRLVAGLATVGAVGFSIIVLVGLIHATRNPRKRLAGLVPLATFPLLLVWPFTEAGRFLVPLVPCLLVGLTEGLAWIVRALGLRLPVGRHRLTTLAAGFVLLIALPYPIYALLTNRAKAQRLTDVDFDAACGWIARHATRPGPVMTRHPGEVFWQTDRKVVAPKSDDVESLSRQLVEENVAYLLVDPDRFANAPPTPLSRLVPAHPERFRLVRAGVVEVYEIRRDSAP